LRRRRRCARNHPAGTKVTATPAPILSGQGSLTITIIIIIMITVAPVPGLSGRGCLCGFAHDLNDFAPDYALPSFQQRLAARPDGWPPSLMEAGAP
jgi:hypothetical protein